MGTVAVFWPAGGPIGYWSSDGAWAGVSQGGRDAIIEAAGPFGAATWHKNCGFGPSLGSEIPRPSNQPMRTSAGPPPPFFYGIEERARPRCSVSDGAQSVGPTFVGVRRWVRRRAGRFAQSGCEVASGPHYCFRQFLKFVAGICPNWPLGAPTLGWSLIALLDECDALGARPGGRAIGEGDLDPILAAVSDRKKHS